MKQPKPCWRPRAIACWPGGPGRRGGPTAREVEVLGLLARGHSNREIARGGGDHAEDGNESRRAHLLPSLGISSRAAATLYATEHGLMGAFESAS